MKVGGYYYHEDLHNKTILDYGTQGHIYDESVLRKYKFCPVNQFKPEKCPNFIIGGFPHDYKALMLIWILDMLSSQSNSLGVELN